MEIGNNRQTALLIAIVISLSVINTLVGDTAKTLVDSVFGSDRFLASAAVVFLVSAALFSILFFTLLRRLDKIVGASVRTRTSLDDRTIKYLIMGYSPLNVSDVKASVDALIEELDELGVDVVSGCVEAYDMAVKARAGKGHARNVKMPSFNPWQQNLRAAIAHKALERVLVLNPDTDQFDEFKRYLHSALKAAKRDVSIDLISDPEDPQKPFMTWNDQTGERVEPNYENYIYVYNGMRHGLEMISGDGDDKDDETCVDATPGYKPFSIAAAMLTLKRKLVFSYVTTGKTGGKPKYYDVDLTIGRTAS